MKLAPKNTAAVAAAVAPNAARSAKKQATTRIMSSDVASRYVGSDPRWIGIRFENAPPTTTQLGGGLNPAS